MQRRVKGDDRLDLVLILEDIGFVNSKLGRFKDSICAYLEALAIKTKVLGKHHFDNSTLMNSIGLEYLQKFQYADALHYFEGSLVICSQHDGKQDSCTRSFTAVEVMINIATTHLKLCNYTKALHLFEKCQKLLEDVSDGSYQDMKDKHKLTIALTLYEGMEEVYDRMDCPMNTIHVRKEAIKLRRAIAAIESTYMDPEQHKSRKPDHGSNIAPHVHRDNGAKKKSRRASVNALDVRKSKIKSHQNEEHPLPYSTMIP